MKLYFKALLWIGILAVAPIYGHTEEIYQNNYKPNISIVTIDYSDRPSLRYYKIDFGVFKLHAPKVSRKERNLMAPLNEIIQAQRLKQSLTTYPSEVSLSDIRLGAGFNNFSAVLSVTNPNISELLTNESQALKIKMMFKVDQCDDFGFDKKRESWNIRDILENLHFFRVEEFFNCRFSVSKLILGTTFYSDFVALPIENIEFSKDLSGNLFFGNGEFSLKEKNALSSEDAFSKAKKEVQAFIEVIQDYSDLIIANADKPIATQRDILRQYLKVKKSTLKQYIESIRESMKQLTLNQKITISYSINSVFSMIQDLEEIQTKEPHINRVVNIYLD